MSFNRSLLTQITKDLADKKKPAMPKAGAQQKIGESNPYYIDKSDIAGKGAFAKQFIPKGSPINMLHQINQPGVDYDFTQLGRAYNHSEDPNTINRLIGNKRFMVANQDIFPGQELTGDYRMQPDLEQPQEDWKMKNGGQMIKRADGSYSKRGLWDNIRANKGSGKKPTKQMLEQERKIKAKMQGGGEIDIDGQALQGLGKVFSTIGDVMSIPARGVVKALTGKYQDPSQALGVTNPVAAWLTNSLLDPTNLVGAGVAAKVLGTAGKASKVAKVAKGVDKVAEASKAVKIPAPRNISSLGVPSQEIVNALAERGMMLDQRGAFKKAVTPDDVEYFGTYGGRPVVGVNTPIGPEYFYKSTSWGGKKLIKPGDWQTFGQWIDVPNQVDNWFVKGDGYENLYGSQTFKNIAGQMDNVIMQKYGVPKQDLDKFLNFQNVQGNVDTFIPPRQNGGQTYSQLAQNAKNFLKTWNNSPMAQQMLQNSVDQDDPWGLNSAHAEAITDVRNKLIDQAKVNVVVPGNISTSHNGIDAKRGDSNMAGYASYGNWNETLGSELGSFKNPSNYLNHRAPAYVKYQNALSKEIEPGQVVIYADNREQNIDESLLHELSHQSDWSSYFMPNSDIYKIQRYSKPGVKGDYTRYVAKPTETRARLNNFRYNAWKQGLYDPFNQKVNEQQLKKYKRTSWGLDPLDQLRDVYNDKQITDMLNTVSYNEKGPNPEQAQARYGGESDNVKKFMDVYHMKYGGGTPAFKEGGQTRDEREMVNGIANILSKVKDRGNRGEIAKEMIQDFEDEGITYNVKKFMDHINLKYGGTPYTHLQEGGEQLYNDVDSTDKAFLASMDKYKAITPGDVNSVRNNMIKYIGSPLYAQRQANFPENYLGDKGAYQKKKFEDGIARQKAQQRISNIQKTPYHINGTNQVDGNQFNHRTNSVELNPSFSLQGIGHEYGHVANNSMMTNFNGIKNFRPESDYVNGRYWDSITDKTKRPAFSTGLNQKEVSQFVGLARPLAPGATTGNNDPHEDKSSDSGMFADESYGDLMGVRQLLHQKGYTKNFGDNIDQQLIDKAMKDKDISNDFIFKRMYNKYGSDNMIKLNNTIAYNNARSGMAMAQDGGEMEEPYVEEAAPVEVPAQDPTEYTGSSIVDYLTTLGFESSKGFRKQLAKDMGIQGYNFSAAKNLELLNALREAKGLPIGYEESFDPVSAKEMMALEQQRGAYVPMPQQDQVEPQVVSHPMSNTAVPMVGVPADSTNRFYNPRIPVAQARQQPAPAPVKRTAPAPANKPAAQGAPNAFRIPMPAPANPYAGFFDPRIPQNTVPASKAPVAAPVTKGKINPFAAVQPAGSFPGGFNQQQALAAIQNAAAPRRGVAPVKKNVAAPVVKPGIVKLNDVDKTNEENGKAWYTEIADAFSNAVNKAPFDFSKIGLGSTGPNPHFDRETLQHMIVNAAKLVSPEKGVLADSYFKRQALKNNDNLKETKTKFEVPKSGKPAIVTGDTISIDKDRYVIPAMIDLNQTKWGVRNRDEYKNINTEAADITTFQSFENAKDYFKKNLNDPYNSTYVGVDAKGNVKVGNRIDFAGTDYRISKTFGNKIVDFVDEANGSMKLKPTSSKASNRHLSPVVKVMGDDGKLVEGSMNLLIPKKSKDTHSFGQITGGRVIFKTPKGEQYLVSGSAEDIKKAFKQIKGNNPYVEAVTLDNGSYAMGLRTKSQKITAEQLRAYQGSNSTGSAFLYLQPGNYTRQSSVTPPAAAAPKFQFKDVQMRTPNIRTEKDESFKKGHSLKNEQKAIILHHTGYSDATGIDKGMSAAMRGVNQQFSKPGESAHVVIDFDGTRYNYAKPDQVTFHAGKSYLNGRDNVNDFGIGIEFQGDTDRKHLTDKQINSFVEYIAPIIKKNKIPLSSVVTHKKIRQDYIKTNPQDKDVYSKPDLNEYDYKRILKALKDKKVYKFGGSTTGSWLDKYN